MSGSAMPAPGPAPGAKLVFAPKEVIAHYREDGSVLLRSPIPLQGVQGNIVDYLEKWATETPDRVFLGQRAKEGGWDELCYGQAWQRVQAVAEALLELGLTQDTPIAVLSGASLEHAIISYAAMLVGVPVAVISPSYSLLPGALPRLVDIAAVLRPAVVFVQCAEQFQRAGEVPEIAAAKWISATAGQPDTTYIGDLYETVPGRRVALARQAVGPETVGKILFTSGSTGAPKGVMNTQRMLCSAIVASALLVDTVEPPVLLDWLPWHHTLGGNSNLNGALRAGGSLYLDDGRPTTPEAFQKTLDNIREIRPTTLLSVPAALQMLVDALEVDADLRRAFFSRLTRMTFAGASLPQDVWNRLQALAVQTTGQEVVFGSGYGTTETAPGIAITHWATRGGGELGLPVPGLTIKLAPVEDRYEVRVQGPNVTPGYFRRPDLTAAAFDDEGFYQTGDLVQFIDESKPSEGLRFAGRLSENFKLTNGSWVATGELRLVVLEVCQPFASDLVIAGQDRDDIRLMLWISAQARVGAGAPAEGHIDPMHYQTLAAAVAERLQAFNQDKGGKTHRIAAFRILHEAASLGAGEITDKGYVNQRGVLRQRAELVEDLYASNPSAEVIRL